MQSPFAGWGLWKSVARPSGAALDGLRESRHGRVQSPWTNKVTEYSGRTTEGDARERQEQTHQSSRNCHEALRSIPSDYRSPGAASTALDRCACKWLQWLPAMATWVGRKGRLRGEPRTVFISNWAL